MEKSALNAAIAFFLLCAGLATGVLIAEIALPEGLSLAARDAPRITCNSPYSMLVVMTLLSIGAFPFAKSVGAKFLVAFFLSTLLVLMFTLKFICLKQYI